MGKFVAYGRWTRISVIEPLSVLNSDIPPSEVINALETALESAQVIASGYSPEQTIYVTDLDSYVGENFFDLFMPHTSAEMTLPTAKKGQCLILEESTHCWAMSHDIETFDPDLFIIEWQRMSMPSGTNAVFGRPWYDGQPLTLVWPPYRIFEKNRKRPNPIFGNYLEKENLTNDSRGRSIANEYPDCALAILEWRRSPRVQSGWAAVDGKWSSVPIDIPSSRYFVWPDESETSHPDTVRLRERLGKLYTSLLEVGIFGEDISTSWSAGQCGSDVFDHVEARMSELGPILGITKWDEAAICWSGTYYGEDYDREDELDAKYDPDDRVEDMTDRIRGDLITLSKAVTSAHIYFEASTHAKCKATEIAMHIVRLAPAAQLETSWNGNSESAVRVWLAD